MFNMTNVGIRISELRKAKNMTQMELADKMDISFQAVSNWERGSIDKSYRTRHNNTMLKHCLFQNRNVPFSKDTFLF